MLFPYRDENDTVRTPVITIALIAVNVLVWMIVQHAGREPWVAASVCNLGLVPGELTLRASVGDSVPIGYGMSCAVDSGRAPLHIFTSMFLHGGWMHLLGNMWFLWLFGNNIEDSMGRTRFVLFYLICGVAAAAGQVLSEPASIVPMVGASGAISGVMGAYIVLYPRVRVYALVFFFFVTSIALPAWVMLGYWMLLQVVGGLGASGEGGVAFWAHIGGFIAGVVLIKLFARPDYIAQHRAHHWRPRRYGMRDNWR